MTPRARRLAALAFAALALVALALGIVGALCASPSWACLRGRARDAVRIGVVAGPLLAYAAYRVLRGRAG